MGLLGLILCMFLSNEMQVPHFIFSYGPSLKRNLTYVLGWIGDAMTITGGKIRKFSQ